jgi:hypothetical protein
MIYSAGLPLLYFITFIYLTVLYFLDKYYMLKVYRRPPSLDARMDRVARKSLWVLIFLHIIFSIFIYGNADIFEEDELTQESIETKNDVQDITANEMANLKEDH